MSLESGNSPRETLPASWYHEPALYEFERRAVFSKTWILMSHRHQFEKPGQYVRYEIAGFPFFIIKDQKGEISAFLNICRHRAFPLIHQDSGTASIISCKYHGWSYGLKGNLAKAPRFNSIPEFDKTQYSLFKVHTHIDDRGFIFVNLDSAENPSVSWEEQFQGVDTQPRLQNFNMDDYVYDHTWPVEGDFNWKTLVENYNECYHCSTAHPGLAPYISKLEKLDYGCTRNFIEHRGGGEAEHAAIVSPTYLFPNASITMTPTFFYMMSIVPKSATTSLLRYEFYRNTKVPIEDFKEQVDFYRQVETEDKWLANGTQANLQTNTYVAGPLHPDVEQGVAYFETLIRKMLKDHAEVEKEEGKEIWPTKRGLVKAQLNEDEAFCKVICDSTAATSVVSQLAW